VNPLPIEAIEIDDRDAYGKVALDGLLEAASATLDRAGVRVVVTERGRGTARLANLLCWQVQANLELADDAVLSGDQIIHFALHHLADQQMGHEDPRALLFAETLASSADILLLGSLASLEPEPDFVVETMESFAYYYDLYAGSEEVLARVLTRIVDDPFAMMRAVCLFLYAAAEPLLSASDLATTLSHLDRLVEDDLYPLVHHYNMTNWILAIRAARLPEQEAGFDPAQAFSETGVVVRQWCESGSG